MFEREARVAQPPDLYEHRRAVPRSGTANNEAVPATASSRPALPRKNTPLTPHQDVSRTKASWYFAAVFSITSAGKVLQPVAHELLVVAGRVVPALNAAW
jgi:hypothetical protein